MSDRFGLERFVEAQAPVYAQVVSELRSGQKRSHWMWFVFPQIEGLGRSVMARRFAIASREEAAAYFKHAVLGPRLIECTRLVLAVADMPIGQILGSPDDTKFRSSMTLFGAVTEHRDFSRALDRFYAGSRDQATLDILATWENSRY